MTILRDIIRRAIESTSDDVRQWHQKPIVQIAQAIHDKIEPEMDLDNLRNKLQQARDEVKGLKQQIEELKKTEEVQEDTEEVIEEVTDETKVPTKKKKKS